MPSLCAPLSSQTATLCATTVQLTSTTLGAPVCNARMPGACCWGTAVSLIALLATSWREELVKVSKCWMQELAVPRDLLSWGSYLRRLEPPEGETGGISPAQGAVKQAS